MKKFASHFLITLLCASLFAATASAAADAQLKLPDFNSLADKASESVTITLDAALLGMAAGFLDANKPEDAAAKELISGLRGVYVRSYTFDADFAYPQADVDNVRKQLSAPGWRRLVEVRSRKEQAHVDIYISTDRNKANGLAIIASEPREFTIVNIVGSIDLQKLHQLEGQFGIPKLQLEEKKPATPP
jgi:hypothetical protein